VITYFKRQSEPAIVRKLKQRGRATYLDRVEKEKVRKRDGEACRVCGRTTRDVHERLFKSKGGVASLENSMCACRTCHPFLQHHAIAPFGKDCHHRLTFEMNEAVAQMVFRGRPVPKHVTVVRSNTRNG
jgi:hypothetical protein